MPYDSHAAEELVLDCDAAISFLSQIRPTGFHNIVAIEPTSNKIDAITIAFPDAIEKAERFVIEHADRNLYYSPNEPKPGAPNRKLSKSDIGPAIWLNADIDVKGERSWEDAYAAAANIERTLPATFKINSGGGLQLLWKIDPTEHAEAEAHNKELIRQIGCADATQNVDRILRLPGTINHPTPQKAKSGRTPAIARMLHHEVVAYSREEIAAACPIVASTNGDYLGDRSQPVASSEMGEVDIGAAIAVGIDSNLQAKLNAAMERRPWLKNRWEGGTERMKDTTRSGFDFSLTGMLRGEGFSGQEIACCLAGNPYCSGSDLTPRKFERCWKKSPSSSGPLSPELAFEKVDLETEGNGNLRSELQLIAFSEATYSPRSNHLIKGILDQESMAVMYGQSNTGKSFVALDMAFHIAAGRAWSGRAVAQGGVVYFAAEAGRSFAKRVVALREHFGISETPIFYCPEPIDLLGKDSPNSDAERMISAIRQCQAFSNVNLAVVDTLASVSPGGNENTSEDMTRIVSAISRIRSETGIAVLLVHHSGKDESKGARGHSSLRAATDTEIEIKRPNPTGMGTISVTKQRDGEFPPPTNFTLSQIAIGKTDEGEEVTSCVVTKSGDSEWSLFEAEFEALPGRTKSIMTALVDASDWVKENTDLDHVPDKVWRAFYANECPDAAVRDPAKQLEIVQAACSGSTPNGLDAIDKKVILKESMSGGFRGERLKAIKAGWTEEVGSDAYKLTAQGGAVCRRPESDQAV